MNKSNKKTDQKKDEVKTSCNTEKEQVQHPLFKPFDWGKTTLLQNAHTLKCFTLVC